jgi:hypothetical protein
MFSREEVLEVVRNLRVNRFDAVLAENGKAALDQILKMIPIQLTVGVANSVTVRQIGVLEALKHRGNLLVDPISQIYGKVDFQEETFMETYRKTLGTDVFISGTNAVTKDGILVNIDGAGNRVAGIIWGSRKSIIVVGRNKIVENTDEAIKRIKSVITPTFARRRQMPLPCAKVGKCVNCNVPARACNITVFIEKRPVYTEIIVIMVDEDLGLGWDPAWPKEEIERIRAKYEEFDWPYPSAFQTFFKASRPN